MIFFTFTHAQFPRYCAGYFLVYVIFSVAHTWCCDELHEDEFGRCWPLHYLVEAACGNSKQGNIIFSLSTTHFSFCFFF